MLDKENRIVLGQFKMGKSDDPEVPRPFMMACRDYESEQKSGFEEAWTLAWLSEEEARQVYEILKTYFG